MWVLCIGIDLIVIPAGKTIEHTFLLCWNNRGCDPRPIFLPGAWTYVDGFGLAVYFDVEFFQIVACTYLWHLPEAMLFFSANSNRSYNNPYKNIFRQMGFYGDQLWPPFQFFLPPRWCFLSVLGVPTGCPSTVLLLSGHRLSAQYQQQLYNPSHFSVIFELSLCLSPL